MAVGPMLRTAEAPRLPLSLLAAAAILVALATGPAWAQEADELIENEIVAEAGAEGVSLSAQGGFVYQGDADLDGGGSMQAFRYDLGVAGSTSLTDSLRWGNTFFFSANDYDFDGGGVGFAAGDPWGTALTMRWSSELTYDLDEKWGVSAGGIFTFAPESGADWGDSFTGGGLLAVEYRHSDTLFTSVGVAVVTQIEDDPAVLPRILVNWLPTEDWAVRVGSVPASGGAAAAVEAAYRLAEPVDLGFGVIYQERRFRLDDSGPAPDGVGDDRSLPVRLRLGWRILPELSLHLLGGVAVAGKVELDDRDGNLLRKADYDPAAYVGLRVLGRF